LTICVHHVFSFKNVFRYCGSVYSHFIFNICGHFICVLYSYPNHTYFIFFRDNFNHENLSQNVETLANLTSRSYANYKMFEDIFVKIFKI
jgi:hypothetical protein